MRFAADYYCSFMDFRMMNFEKKKTFRLSMCYRFRCQTPKNQTKNEIEMKKKIQHRHVTNYNNCNYLLQIGLRPAVSVNGVCECVWILRSFQTRLKNASELVDVICYCYV